MHASRLLRGLVVLTAGLYIATTLGAIAVLRFAGERWWPSTAGLYFPRFPFLLPLPILTLALIGLKLYRALWTQAVAAVLVVFPLMGFAVHLPTLRASGAPVVRLLSYNVDSGGAGYPAILEEVDRYSPDVAFFQELGGPVDSFAQLLKQRYATVIQTGQFMMATRYPVASEANPEKVLYGGRARSPRFTQYRIETPLGPIAFYNVHPISPREGLYALRSGGLRRKILSGHWLTSFDSRVLMSDAGLREAQVQDFTQAAARESLPVVIAGDTNLPGLSRILNENLSGYQDGFAAAGQGFGFTFPTGKAWMRIDRVFASATLKFVGFQVGRSEASDHHCVVADLQAR